MKILYSMLLPLLWVPVLVSAQDESPVKLGLRIAPSISWLSTSTEGYNSEGIRAGVSGGLVTDFFFAKNYAISTGFSIDFPSGKMSYHDLAPYNDTILEVGVNATFKLVYFEIPLLLKMKTNKFGNFKFFGQIGLGTGFRIKATAESEVTNDVIGTENRKTSISNKTTLMREAIIAGIGMEYYFDESTCLFAGFNYSNALNNAFKSTNLLTNQEVKAHPNFLELSIGVLF